MMYNLFVVEVAKLMNLCPDKNKLFKNCCKKYRFVEYSVDAQLIFK